MLINEFKVHFNKSLIDIYPQNEVNSFFRILTDHFFQWPPTFSVLNPDHRLTAKESNQLSAALLDLIKHKPVQYITQEAFFYNRNFYVDENVLIPRPETEELISWVLEDSKDNGAQRRVLDIGTGSGCIPITLAKEENNFTIDALDISTGALEVAKKNAQRHKVEINFFKVDIRESISWPYPLDIMIANPPYVEPDEKNKMLPNVLEYEPHLALFTPHNHPLFYYDKIIELSRTFLKSGGCLYLEINPVHATALATLIKANHFDYIEIRNDIFGKKRMLKALKS